MSEAAQPVAEKGQTGYRIVYVRDGEPLASTFIPETGAGLAQDFINAAPEFAAKLGIAQ